MEKGALLLFSLLVLVTCGSAQDPQVGFSELDYSNPENSGGRTITVSKTNQNTETLFLIITALTFDEFGNLSNRILPADLVDEVSGVDPAEFTAERQDFNVSMEILVSFPPSNLPQEEQIFIPYIDDDINEAEEGFLVIIEIDDTQTDPASVGFVNEGVALMRITNDDEIRLGFENPEYTVGEDAGMQNDLINVIKVDNVVSEQILPFLIDLSVSVSNPATEGVDFTTLALPLEINFSPDEQNIFIPVIVIEDDILEAVEQFQLTLGVPPDAPPYLVGTAATIVSILDNEVGVVGFEQLEYSGVEGTSIEVCVAAFFSGTVEGIASISLTSAQVLGTASAVDYGFSGFFFGGITLSSPGFRTCIGGTVDFTDDTGIEGSEDFTIELVRSASTPDNIILDPNVTLVTILDNDFAPTSLAIAPSSVAPTSLAIAPSSDFVIPTPTPVNGVGGDPHYSILLPTGQMLCFSVHGEKGFSFNLISNDLLQMNALFIQDPIREEITWIGSLGIVVKNTPNPYSKSNTTKIRFEAVEKKIFIGDKASLVAQRVERLTFSKGKLTISQEPGRKKPKRHEVHVDLQDIGLSFSVSFVKDHLDLSWGKVDQQPIDSHGLIGQFLRNGNEIDETRKLLLLPNLDPVPVMRKKVWHFMEREVPDDQLCWVAMNPGYQGKRLIEGHYLDYLVDDVISDDFKFKED